MSQMPRGKYDWLKNNYEKIILLCALLALLLSCVMLVMNLQNNRTDVALSLARLDWRGTPIALKDTVPFVHVLAEARQAATEALNVAPRTTVSELRVSCIKCGRPIPYDAMECPFCLSLQPEIVNVDTLDTDDDGIPDSVELAWGLDPQNPNDVGEDIDGDGFTNLEEFLYGTDPRDPDNHPPLIVKLRVLAIRPLPFYLRFVSVSTLADGTRKFQLNLQTLERTYFVEIGDEVEGYRVETYNPAASEGETLTLVRQTDKRAVSLIKGRPVTEQELVIRFISMLDRNRLPRKRLGEVIEVYGGEYKVVDIRRENVVIQDVQTSVKVTVPVITTAERAALSGARPATSAPATESSFW